MDLVFCIRPLACSPRLTVLAYGVGTFGHENTRTKLEEVISRAAVEFVTNGRPYKVFIATPVIFCCAALFLLFRGVLIAPLTTFAAAVFMFSGIPLYYVFVTGWRQFPGLRIGSSKRYL